MQWNKIELRTFPVACLALKLISGALIFLYYYQLNEKEKSGWTLCLWSNSLWTDYCFFKDNLLSSVSYLSKAVICKERISPLAAGYSCANTNNTQLASLMQGHTTDLQSTGCPLGLSRTLLQSWCFLMIENCYSQQKNPANPSFTFILQHWYLWRLKRDLFSILLDVFKYLLCIHKT